MNKILSYIQSFFVKTPSLSTQSVQTAVLAPRQYPITTPLDNREKLYNCAVTFLGKDLHHLADKEVACAESVSHVLESAGFSVGTILSTFKLGTYLTFDKRFMKIDSPLPGDVIVYETGTGNGNLPNGHTGIVGVNGDVMSNNSDSGLFDLHLTLGSMKQRYEVFGGMKPHYFRVV